MSGLPLAILRRLRRSLIYGTVDSVLNRSVRVSSYETAVDDVLAEARAGVPLTSAVHDEVESSDLVVIQKYGILDFTYRVTLAELGLSPAGLGVLRSLGLVDASDPNPPDWDHAILAELADEAEAGALYLKVFLRTVDELPPHAVLRRLEEGLPPQFWPHDFVVEDACVTNAKGVWLAKHVYL